MTTHFPPPAHFSEARINPENYAQQVAESITQPEVFWAKVAERLEWIKPFTRVKDVSFALDDFRIRWFDDGVLNVSVNCLDRHLEKHGERTAIIAEADTPGHSRRISYRQLHAEVCQLANALRRLGVQKGDVVTIYLPMVPEAAVAMLACARVGAIHSVVFGGFSPESLIGRIADCQSKLVVTADVGQRGGKPVPLKANVDQALLHPSTACVRTLIVLQNSSRSTVTLDQSMPQAAQSAANMQVYDYHALLANERPQCVPEPMQAEDPLFILYTSGSTGKPKGVLHTTAGYLLYASYTHECVFDLRADDIYWCTADVGWVTGHSYVVYGPLCNAATTLMFEGVPNYPSVSRFWQVIDQHQVSIFYTAPTAIRALMRDGDAPVQACNRRSLRLLGTVGEPINPEAWLWYHRVVGDGRCPIIDTWWQTETGGILISPLPGVTTLKPGSATQPFFGVRPALMDAQGQTLLGAAEGNLVLLDSWPGQMRSVYGDHQRFIDTYFKAYPGSYFTGDGAKRDADGDYWITGRVDDVINVAGHRLGTAEIESALVSHLSVAEAAVVGFPHDIKGQGIYAFVTLKADSAPTDALRADLIYQVRTQIGPIATPDMIQWAPGLPKTRSGKIMRRILRKIAAGETEQLGDISTLADPAVVAFLVGGR